MTNDEYDLNAIPLVERSGSLDINVYQGQKYPIEEIEIKKEIDFYRDESGNAIEYDAKSTSTCFKVYIYTAPLKEYDKINKTFSDKILEIPNEDGTKRPVRIKARFNLLKSKDGKPEISKHPKSYLWRFMKKMGVESLAELKGKLVMLDIEPSRVEGDDRKFLKIST